MLIGFPGLCSSRLTRRRAKYPEGAKYPERAKYPGEFSGVSNYKVSGEFVIMLFYTRWDPAENIG
jgi:hypothetical protein